MSYISVMSYYHLIIRYPLLKKFISQCLINNEDDKLYDFLIEIETD